MSILWALVVLLVILWVLGISVNLGGGLIHLLIVLAVIVLLYNLFVGRRSGGL
ncbi:MAG: lmo0937 family membrane protein [Dehalococcoidia bacterium]|nr:lmo0937 family membrane protein [Dehalococcoidia bacterium]